MDLSFAHSLSTCTSRSVSRLVSHSLHATISAAFSALVVRADFIQFLSKERRHCFCSFLPFQGLFARRSNDADTNARERRVRRKILHDRREIEIGSNKCTTGKSKPRASPPGIWGKTPNSPPSPKKTNPIRPHTKTYHSIAPRISRLRASPVCAAPVQRTSASHQPPHQRIAPVHCTSAPHQCTAPAHRTNAPHQCTAPAQRTSAQPHRQQAALANFHAFLRLRNSRG